jgi:hypothetical protein
MHARQRVGSRATSLAVDEGVIGGLTDRRGRDALTGRAAPG